MTPSVNAEAFATLRAAAESRQIYNHALLSRLVSGQQQQQLATRLQTDRLGYSQSFQFFGGPPPSSAIDMLFGAGQSSQMDRTVSSVNPAPFGVSAGEGTAGGCMSSSDGTNTALTRHLLQLLQSRQDVGRSLVGSSDSRSATRDEEEQDKADGGDKR